jgi:hypothetical protein
VKGEVESASGRGTWRKRGNAQEKDTQPASAFWQKKINIQFKAIYYLLYSKNKYFTLSQHISNHIKHREEIESLWKL